MKKNKNTHIYIAFVLKIITGIYAWLNFFDVLPGNFQLIILGFLFLEFSERFFVNLFKIKYEHNYWEINGINYDIIFLLWIMNLLIFWSTFLLIVYVVIFQYGWFLAIVDSVLIYTIGLYYLSKKFAQLVISIENIMTEAKVFWDSLDW